MELYTQRHGMGKPKEKTYEISMTAYSLLLECCEKYYDYLAWKYPQKCDTCHKCISLNTRLLEIALKREIPDLFRRNGDIDVPKQYHNIFAGCDICDEYNQYALLDLIEFVAINCKDYDKSYNSACNHIILDFNHFFNNAFDNFKTDINDIFDLMGILYTLNDNRQIERIVENETLTKEVEETVLKIKEDETRKLLKEAIDLYKSPYPNSRRDATEKIWDAFERLKTYYGSDKKQSAAKIVTDISNGSSDFKTMIEAEFKALTDIGNGYRIRHHETDKIDITDIRHYDYFFNRCLSLIALAVQYLE